MDTTIEVRWFRKGIPPPTVQNWFRFRCPGKLMTEASESRKDFYIYQKLNDFPIFQEIEKALAHKLVSFYLTSCEEINLKLRQQNLELKLKQQELGTKQFCYVNNSVIWSGNIEQWCKLTEAELQEHELSNFTSIPENYWICVHKKRQQKVERRVKSELTWLTVNNNRWWSIAFEMTMENYSRQENNCFLEVLNQACQTYSGPNLSADNSYSYSAWLLQL